MPAPARVTQTPARAILVMGVSGCGKSSLGSELATRLGAPFLEGDALHPESNRRKMAEGVPLDDGDRWPWLEAVGRALGEAARSEGRAVAACSALKRAYRRALTEAAGLPLVLVHIHAPAEVLRARMAARSGHFMPLALLDSQLATLEPPEADEAPLCLDASRPLDRLVTEALVHLDI